MATNFKQAFKSFMLGGISTIVDLILYFILHYFALRKYATIPFKFGPFNYEANDGGLCNFISMAVSYLISSVVNYFVQRKYTFNATGKTSRRNFYLFILTTLFVYMIVLYIPGVIGAPINSLFGLNLGSLISKAIATFVGFLIQYPINKNIIFPQH